MNVHGGSAHQSGSKVAGARKAPGLSEVGKRKEHRALRPRPEPTAPKVKKRTRFHEVKLGEGDGPRIVGRRIKVFWPLEKKFFYGHVKAFNGARKLQHKIVYDDKDEEWLRLQDEVFGIELLPGEVFGETASLAPAVEASSAANGSNSIVEDSNEHKRDVSEGGPGIKPVEGAGEGRIKPEGVYRRKRKAERVTEEAKELEQRNESQKKAEEDGETKKTGDREGEPKTKRLKGMKEQSKTSEGTRDQKKTLDGISEQKKTSEGNSEQKSLGETSEQKRKSEETVEQKKSEGASEEKKFLGRKLGGLNRRGEAKQRSSSGRANGQRSSSSGNSGGREHRTRGVHVTATSTGARERGLTADGSIDRRKRVRKEMSLVKGNSVVQTRTRHSVLAVKEGKKMLRSRIRDNDRLFSSVKASSAVIRRKVAESKRSKDIGSSKEGRSDAKHFNEENILVKPEKLVSLVPTSRKRKHADLYDPTSTKNQRADALGPFEAVMDAYREALSGNKDDLPSTTSDEAPSYGVVEEPSIQAAVSGEDEGVVGSRSLASQDDQGDEQLASNIASGRSGGPSLRFNDDRQQAGNEAESDTLSRQEFGSNGQRGMIGEMSSAEVVLTPPIPPVTGLPKSELKLSPDKVYRRLKKYQPDKVYRRLKHSRNKQHKEGVDEQAYVPQTIVRVAQYWFLARELPSAFHVLSYGARIAALGSSLLPSFDRIAFSRLQCRSSTGDVRLQLGTFYGPPSIQSLLRVSWNSLYWLLVSVSGSVKALDNASPLSVGKLVKSKLQVVTASRGFKRRGISSRRASRWVTSFRQLIDPTRDSKCLSLNTHHYFRGLGLRSRRIVCVPRCSSFVGSPLQTKAPRSAPRELRVISSAHLTPPPQGHATVRLYTGGFTVLLSDDLKQALYPSDPRIRRRRASTVNVQLNRAFEAAMRAWSVVTFPIATVTGEENRGSRSRSRGEVGAYYGRRSLQSLYRCARDEVLRMDVGSLTFTRRAGSEVSVDLMGILRAIADLHASGGVPSFSRIGLASDNLCEEDALSSIFARGYEGAGGEPPWTRTLETPFLCRYIIGALSSSFILGTSDHTRPRYGGAIPRPVPVFKEFLSSGSPPLVIMTPEIDRSLGSAKFDSQEGISLEEDGVHYASCERSSSDYQSTPVVSDGKLGTASVVSTAVTRLSSDRAHVRVCDTDSDYRQIGAYYGPPCFESLLRLSKDLCVRLLVEQRKAKQNADALATAPHVLDNVETERLTRVQCPESSFEIIDEDESSEEDRMQARHGRGTTSHNLYANLEEPSSIGDGFDSCMAQSGPVAAMKKGRRTGKSLKRDTMLISNESLVRDGSEADSFPDGDLLSGRPYSKRTKVEIESSGAATKKDNGLEMSPPSSDLEGKGFTAPSVSGRDTTKDTTKASSQPRVNILKLRRCPTNKGLWLVAGNSCAIAQDKGVRGVGAEAETVVYSDSRDIVESGEAMTPALETNRKRVLEQCQEAPQLRRSDHNRNQAGATQCSSGSQGPEITASASKPTKGYSLNSKAREVWFDCGIASMNGGLPDGVETRKRRRKGPSPIPCDDAEGISENSGRRSADSGWGCSANVLITKSDRCVRETGAVVELQPGHENSWMLTIILRGESKYALKADHPVPSGTTNKYTHSMMWRGGKAWSLEFVDRKQWLLFKDLHEECFQRNARAASVRHIPIPGVKPIQECPKSGLRFVRPSFKYIHQFDGEVEMALASTRIIYDMDSEDEGWLDSVNNENDYVGGTRSRPNIDEDTLERVMDKLEKTSFLRPQDPISGKVAVELCQSLGSEDVVKSIHAYWYRKRLRKGMALVRHFQPAPWEQYQTQLRDWQAEVDRLQEQSPTATKQQLQSLCKRPPLFAFCLRPRGLENRNKMQKQRSQRKQGLGGSSSRQWTLAGPPNDTLLDSPSKRHQSFDSNSGPFFGPRKFVRQRSQEDRFSDPMAVDLTESFNALAADGFPTEGVAGTEAPFRQVDGTSVLRVDKSTVGGFNKRNKKLGRKAKKMKLLAAAEESRRKRQLRAQQGHLNGSAVHMVLGPQSVSEMSQVPLVTDGFPLLHVETQEDDKVAQAKAAGALAKAKREQAVALRSRAQALYAVADAAMHKAVAAVIAADAIHAAERADEEVADRMEQEPAGSMDSQRHQTGEVPVAVKNWGHSGIASGGGTPFGSWRRALNSASKNVTHVLSKGSGSKPVVLTDTDDALLPVASWSQELGAGLGTRLLQTGEVSPQRQRYSPVLVEGLSKSPTRGVRGDGALVSLGRTRGESMMAMLTR